MEDLSAKELRDRIAAGQICSVETTTEGWRIFQGTRNLGRPRLIIATKDTENREKVI